MSRINHVILLAIWVCTLTACSVFERGLTPSETQKLIRFHRVTPLLVGEYAQRTVILYQKENYTGCMVSGANSMIQEGGDFPPGSSNRQSNMREASESNNRISRMTFGDYPYLDTSLIVLHIPYVNSEYVCVLIADPSLEQRVTTMDFYSFDGSVSTIAIDNGIAVFGRYTQRDAEFSYRSVVFYDANHTVVAASEPLPSK